MDDLPSEKKGITASEIGRIVEEGIKKQNKDEKCDLISTISAPNIAPAYENCLASDVKPVNDQMAPLDKPLVFPLLFPVLPMIETKPAQPEQVVAIQNPAVPVLRTFTTTYANRFLGKGLAGSSVQSSIARKPKPI